MHSILESDGVSSDPFEVLCYMGTLIVEGRTPKTAGDVTASSETAAKSAKPYTEGPHCPNFMKLYNKDTHNVHKCTENNIICIRYNNLKQHLQTLQQKSPSISIEVSLGPDCLCGELRSQSTLVSSQPSKRDIILEKWTITIGHKQMQEPSSQMSVMNLYQAVRSLLHFSQLTAWYMSNNGMRPSHVIYRVGLPEDSTFICDDNFVSHDFPVADVNKTVWMKISVKTLPRMEKIPTVFCPQHLSSTVEAAQSSQEPPKKEPLHGRFGGDGKGEMLEAALPLKFQGVRKKTYEAQERKRKKHIALFGSQSPLGIEKCSGVEFLDGMPIEVQKMSPQEEVEYFTGKRMFQGETLKPPYQGECSKADYKKSKSSAFPSDFSELVKPQPNFEAFDAFSCNFFEQKVVGPPTDLVIGLKSFSDSKSNSDYRTKEKPKPSCDASESSPDANAMMDILDDRMQISCAISGKHHCKWECEEESDLNNPGGNVEKPKRRRSLSKARAGEPEDVRLDSEKILHGKFKEIDSYGSESRSPLREQAADEAFPSSSGCSRRHLESPPKPKTIVDISSNSGGSPTKSQTPKIERLPVSETPAGAESCEQVPGPEGAAAEAPAGRSTSPRESPPPNTWVRTESFESFRRGCAFARAAAAAAADDTSDSEGDSSDCHQETANPFLAAILRTTRKSRTNKKCDNSLKNKPGDRVQRNGPSLQGRLAGPAGDDAAEKRKTKAEPREKVQSEAPECRGRKNLDLRTTRKKSSGLKVDRSADRSPSEFLSRSFARFKTLFDTQDLRNEATTYDGLEDIYDEIGSNSCNSTKTIPVPSAHDKLKFRRSLDSAAQLVFHRCSGLPLTSSPAPVRRNNNSFSFDSSLNSVSAIKSALFEPSNSLSSEDENESEGSLKSPASPGAWSVGSKPINYHSLSPLPLLGSFEESVLNGRLEPVSTVQGFTAELGASGSFCPRHLNLPVTVFFYTLGDNDKVSAPYLGHINLGKKGYSVPRSGTIQVTLFNPLRTVVKMFVVVYDLHDMPANSHTFLRQRTLYVPTSQKEATVTDKKETPFDQEDYHKYLRYLIHLRFVSGKTGRIYLHTDIRMVIFRKADEDTATALDDGETYELRSHTHGPTNPKFSPRK